MPYNRSSNVTASWDTPSSSCNRRCEFIERRAELQGGATGSLQNTCSAGNYYGCSDVVDCSRDRHNGIDHCEWRCRSVLGRRQAVVAHLLQKQANPGKFNRVNKSNPVRRKCVLHLNTFRYETIHERAHWHHLANTIESSICGGDAVLCQTRNVGQCPM